MSQEALYQNQLARDRRQSGGFRNKAVSFKKIFKIKKEIEVNKVSIILRLALIFAIFGDLVDFIPIAGSFISGAIAIVILILLFFDGLGRGSVNRATKKQVKKWSIRITVAIVDTLPFIGWLPMLTVGVMVEIFLAQKKVKKLINKMEEIKNKLK